MSQSKIMKRLATNPKAMMEFQARGKMPRLREALETPLLRLLKSMAPRDRVRFQGVKLSPKLGYQSNAEFRDAEILFRWLGGHGQMGEWETLPSETVAIRSFNKPLTLQDLKAHCQSFPEQKPRKRGSDLEL